MSSGGGKSQTVGYKYYAGVHMALCHGPVDKLVRVRVGGKDAWLGDCAGGQIQIDKPDLFGGEKREGGISGSVDIEMGGPTQGQNNYLASKLGSDLLPAFRGICCAVLRQCYMGMNPYLKDWAWLLQRIHTRHNGEEQWYDEKAEIPVPGSEAYVIRTVIADSIKISATWSKADPFYLGIQPGNAEWTPGEARPVHLDLDPAKTYAVEFLDTGPRKAVCLDTTRAEYLWTWSTYVSASYDNSGEWSENIGNTTPYASENLAFAAAEGTEYYISGKSAVDFFIWDGPTEIKLLDNEGSVTFKVTKIENIGAILDMNPAHIVRECLTDSSWGLGYADADVDNDSFTAAADKLYAEGMGISILWAQQTSLEDFIADILRHIDGTLFVDRATGKFKIKLVRADYVESSLLVLNKTNISRVENYTCQTQSDLVNEVTVLYHSHKANGQDSVTLQNIALIQQQGAIVPATVEYPGFTNSRIAARACARDLKAMSTPLVSCTIYANRTAAGLGPGDPFVWRWEEKDEAGNGVVTSYVMRVSDIAYGDGIENAVKIVCSQDVFDLPSIVYVEVPPTEWTSPIADPLPATPRLVMEAPYYEIVRKFGDSEAAAKLTALPELGYLMVAAGRAASEINAELQVDSGAGYADGGSLDFCPSAKLDGAIGYLDIEATIKEGVDLDDFVGGSLAQIGGEIIVIEAIIDGVATIRRGCLDTIPEMHADGSDLIIWDGYTTSDGVEYIISDELGVKIITSAGAQLALINAPIDSVVFEGRADRPYPPANVKINNTYFPETLQTSGEIDVTWAHRDRTQQTGGEIIGWTASDVGPEDGVTYSVALKKEVDGSALAADDAITTTSFSATGVTFEGNIIAEVSSFRGSVQSRLFRHVFTHVVPSEFWQPDAYTSIYLNSIDADSITLNGSTASQWSDKSANARHATMPAAGNQATYAPGFLSFDAAASPNYDYYDLPLAEYGALFFVVKKKNANNKGWVCRDSRTNDRDGLAIASNGVTSLQRGDADGAITSGPAVTIGQWAIIYAEANGTTRALRVNGGAETTVANTSKINLNQLGYYHYLPPSYCFEGDMAFVVGFASTPDETTRQKVEGFLAHAMNNGLGVDDILNGLPVDHPYKTAAPV